MRPHYLTSLLLVLPVYISMGNSQGASQIPLPVPRPLFQVALVTPDIAILQAALVKAHAGEWRAAEKLISPQAPPIHQKIMTFLRLIDPRSKSQFAEVSAFLSKNPDWPWQLTLRRRAEALMPVRRSPDMAIDWFKAYPPLTAAGKIRQIAAYDKRGETGVVADLVRRAWHRTAFIKSQERRFYKRYRQYLNSDDHWTRLDYLLWRGQSHSAQRASWYVSKTQKTIAQARLELRRQSPGVDQAISLVPAAFRDDPGLVYERVRWRRQKQLTDPAVNLLRTAPAPGLFERKWWVERRVIIRRLLRERRAKEAYAIAADHQQSGGTSFAEGEWLAGWIALTHLNDAGRSVGHFKALINKVTTPISLARGHFWAGRALAKNDALGEAQAHFARAANHPTTFYGQLAVRQLNRAHVAFPVNIAGTLDEAFRNDDLVKATRALAAARDRNLTEIFFRALVRAQQANLTPTTGMTAAQLAKFGIQIQRPDLAVYAARQAARKGRHLIADGYPFLGKAARGPNMKAVKNVAVETALLHGLIRQESAFNGQAISRVGARGLMQLMPATARQIARTANLEFNKNRLLEDPHFNLKLGQFYLHQMIAQFAGSYPLALAAYNAGPHRVKRWLRDYGDPRTGAIEMIDWIESIPFNETRNYVQRVLEATVVYRHKEAQLNTQAPAYLTAHQWCLVSCQDSSIAAAPELERSNLAK